MNIPPGKLPYLLRLSLVMSVIATATLAALPLQAYAVSKSVALKEFQTKAGPVRFFGASSQHDFYIPLYAKDLLQSIELDVEYTNSISLISGISQMVVMADGFVTGQAGLMGSSPGGRERFIIPAELLNGDIMRLTLMVNQHYDTDCESPNAGQLWTDINPVKSRLIFTWRSMPERTGLRQWINTFSPSNPFLSRAAIIIPESGRGWLDATCAISAWLTSVRSYRPLEFRVSTKPVSGMPNVILGPEPFIKSTLDAAAALLDPDPETGRRPVLSLPAEVTGPFIATMPIPLPRNNTIPCLIVTGRNTQEAVSAAMKLAEVQQNWPENNWLSLDAAAPPPLPPYKRDCLVPETDYSFRELGLYSNMVFEGMGVVEKSVTVHIPPEIFRQENRYAKLHLDIIYSAGLREDSSLHINVNGTLTGSIPLNNPDGKTFTDYLINIPMSFFKGGHNNLSFKVVMKPFRAQKCAPVGQESMVTTILNSSEISIPTGFKHYSLPDLALLMDDMFPYSFSVENRKPTALIVREARNIKIFESVVNFSALFARRLGTPYNYLHITKGLAKDFDGNAVFIETVDHIEVDIRKDIPIFGSPDKLKYLLPGKKEVVLNITNSMKDSRMLITELEFPQGSTRTALVLTAEDASVLRKGIRLISGSPASRLYGDTTLIDTTTGDMQSYSMNRQYQTGRLGIQGPAGNWLTSRPEYYYPLLLIVVLVTGVMAFYLIKRRNRMRRETFEDE